MNLPDCAAKFLVQNIYFFLTDEIRENSNKINNIEVELIEKILTDYFDDNQCFRFCLPTDFANLTDEHNPKKLQNRFIEKIKFINNYVSNCKNSFAVAAMKYNDFGGCIDYYLSNYDCLKDLRKEIGDV